MRSRRPAALMGPLYRRSRAMRASWRCAYRARRLPDCGDVRGGERVAGGGAGRQGAGLTGKAPSATVHAARIPVIDPPMHIVRRTPSIPRSNLHRFLAAGDTCRPGVVKKREELRTFRMWRKSLSGLVLDKVKETPDRTTDTSGMMPPFGLPALCRFAICHFFDHPSPCPDEHAPSHSISIHHIGHVEKRQLETCPEYDRGHFIGFESHGYSPFAHWDT